ncbi:hypothetical protein RG47T_0254 [Mucilaginibacter polytrichastri]|uniref:Uncharacterized protein n=1 Tax=Mucilaginibacter polytrichastri TaxID=1302689 RepID=A0A1Q5ZSS2_9SPHI|nr:hypothetical protein RG47T_0254 [Mucilaginibacter polytrichastri]
MIKLAICRISFVTNINSSYNHIARKIRFIGLIYMALPAILYQIFQQ